ncbi:hypothetical protein ACET3Z_002004 [Daucus carota]|uniref:Uncharacterized protein n=3 Tax=Daucus carota subsp. sativus TaxID=79200 RepID=A0A166H1Q9_DAUCS|nr:PREDICTED: uncharacterized protein LOC108200338 [Daucus carota subsp. sativus]
MMMQNQQDDNPFLTTITHQEPIITHREVSENTSGSTKRKLLFSSSSPVSKKPNLSPSPVSSPVLSPHSLQGFKKIQLPPTILRRTISEPLDPNCRFSNPLSPEILERSLSDLGLVEVKSPENDPRTVPVVNVVETTPSSLPPRSPVLGRKISDAMSSGKIGSDSKESPSSLELKKIKKGLRQMSQWFSEALEMEDDQEEEEEEQKGCLCKHKTENPKGKECSEAEKEIDEEAVSVDKTGGCLIIKFKCPCSKAYHLLLSGNSCYYKLI